MSSLILAVQMPSNSSTLIMQKNLIEKGFLIGAIRQPTVKKPILRIIPRIGSSKQNLLNLCQNVKITL
jgi:8-amino-7-oxononanoate synthase